MIKRRWLPALGLVTLIAADRQIAVNRVGGGNVAARALIANVCPQQRMRKRLTVPTHQFRLCMVAMAGHAVRLGQ